MQTDKQRDLLYDFWTLGLFWNDRLAVDLGRCAKVALVRGGRTDEQKDGRTYRRTDGRREVQSDGRIAGRID